MAALAGDASLSAVADLAALEAIVTRKAATVVFFWADWHEPSKPAGQLETVLLALERQHTGISFVKVEAEAAPQVSVKYGVSVVPTFVFVKPGGEVVDKAEGADVPALAQKVQSLAASLPAAPTTATPAATTPAENGTATPETTLSLNERLARLRLEVEEAVGRDRELLAGDVGHRRGAADSDEHVVGAQPLARARNLHLSRADEASDAGDALDGCVVEIALVDAVEPSDVRVAPLDQLRPIQLWR